MRENYPNTVCHICGEVIANNVIKRHLNSHSTGTYDKIRNYRKVGFEGLTCIYCGRECKNRNSLVQHAIRCKNNPDRNAVKSRPKGSYTKGYVGWSRGLTKETDERIAHLSESVKASMKNLPKPTGVGSTPEIEKERRRKISESANNRVYKGYTDGVIRGRGKKGYYKGYWCDSSWELAYIMYNLDHNIEFERNYDMFDYVYEGKVRKYTPDFKQGGKYREIKGHDWPMDLAKYPSVPGLIILRYNDMEPYLKYAENTYGKDFADRYLERDK